MALRSASPHGPDSDIAAAERLTRSWPAARRGVANAAPPRDRLGRRTSRIPGRKRPKRRALGHFDSPLLKPKANSIAPPGVVEARKPGIVRGKRVQLPNLRYDTKSPDKTGLSHRNTGRTPMARMGRSVEVTSTRLCRSTRHLLGALAPSASPSARLPGD